MSQHDCFFFISTKKMEEIILNQEIIGEIRTRFKQMRNVPSAQLWKLMQCYLEEPANALYL